MFPHRITVGVMAFKTTCHSASLHAEFGIADNDDKLYHQCKVLPAVKEKLAELIELIGLTENIVRDV